ncbi:MAG: peptide chain release factor N(5)-glutamine methyltransferase [Nitrospirae bacterium]|nr:peptide chain release factor N(5)-glutamine methyltransferase [Nitrospirota bacterium]
MMMKASQWYRGAVNRLKHGGIANASNEAIWILEFASGLLRLALLSEREANLSCQCLEEANGLLERRANQEPLQYVLGTQEFCGVNFEVGPGVLIPRPETELLVEESLKRLGSVDRPMLADIGTGSGCIAVTLALKVPSARVVAIDKYPVPIEVAKKNVLRHNVADRVELVQGNLLEPLDDKGGEGRFSAIIANPPYICSEEIANLSIEVRDFEPWEALDGGPDGLKWFGLILATAWKYLKPGGLVSFEVGCGQAEAVCQLAAQHGHYHVSEVVRDFSGIERVVCCERTRK